MPTRRIFELTVVTAILIHSASGTIKLWARKTLGTQQAGSVTHGIAEIVVNVL